LARKASLQFTADHRFSFVRSGGDATGALSILLCGFPAPRVL